MINTLLRADYYKCCHMLQYDKRICHLTSYLTPRYSRLKNINEMVFFGLSNFINKYLIEDFNNNFFRKPIEEVEEEFKFYLGEGLGYKPDQIKKTLFEVRGLHNLGYLPIEINALPEGTLCPMQVPAIEIRTTHQAFPWVGQVIESILSSSIWHPCISATVAREYAMIAKSAYEETVDNEISYKTAMSDFSMRGQESYESAVASAAAFLTSFYGSSTVEARDYIKRNYEDKIPVRINGLTSTEHSVMCSDFAINDGDERAILKRLLTEVYPDVSFSAVLDSKNFWKVITKILPTLRGEIENHKGFLGCRDDSGDPVVSLCGIEEFHIVAEKDGLWEDFVNCNSEEAFIYLFQYWLRECEPFGEEVYNKKVYITFYNKQTNFSLKGVFEINSDLTNERGSLTDNKYYFSDGFTMKKIREEKNHEEKGMVEVLYELFGGNINSKGYKVINPKLKAIYGDSITIPRAIEIYRMLKNKGFAANNVSLGVGSFSMECIEEDGELKPFTRDTFSIAIKATYGEILLNEEEISKMEDIDMGQYGVPFNIFKEPIGCPEKKSLMGLCKVIRRQDGSLAVVQQLTNSQHIVSRGEFIPCFKNSKIFKQSFNEIRERLD